MEDSVTGWMKLPPGHAVAAPDAPRPARPQGQAATVEVTPAQARELLAAGAEWKGPAHLRAEVLPDT